MRAVIPLSISCGLTTFCVLEAVRTGLTTFTAFAIVAGCFDVIFAALAALEIYFDR